MEADIPKSETGSARVLLVVVTFRSESTVDPLLETVKWWLERNPRAHLSLVDNSNSHETIAVVHRYVAEHASRVQARVSDRNVGFSPAINQAVRDAEVRWGRFDVIVLMNPDISDAGLSLEGAVEALKDPTIGIASPLLLDDARRVDRGSLRRFLNRRRMFAEILGAPSSVKLLGSSERNMPLAQGKRIIDVEVTAGAFMAIRRDLFGVGLDERLPMYLEDQEICIRARRHGLRVVVLSYCAATHSGGVSRKANTAMTRTLRMMELATAPSLALAEVCGVHDFELRAIVGVAGALRWLAAAAIGLACISSRRHRQWTSEQLALSRWFMAWSMSADALSPVDWAR